ncbi:MAG: AsmA-like C-terminal domain-containing protein [Desulfamplus sp.]|nr:AsmA-like C-terminal domain-containing protein [Desulfamplus sp.]
MKSLQKWLAVFVILCSFIVFVTVSIPVILDSRSVQKLLSDVLSAKIITGVKPDKITFTLFPSPSIEISEISISKTGFKSCTIEKILICLSSESLFKRKFIISKIVLEKPAVPIFSDLLSIPFQGENLFGHLSQEQGDFSVEIKNMTSDIFGNADILINLSPFERIISGDITVNNIMLSSLDNIMLLSLPSLTTLVSPVSSIESYSAKHLKGSFVFKDTETFDIDLALSGSSIGFKYREQPIVKSATTQTAGSAIKIDPAIKIKSAIKIKPSINIDSTICNLVMNKNQFSVTMDSIKLGDNIHLSPFASSVLVKLKHDKNVRNNALLVSGTHANIDAIRPLALKVMPDNLISGKIFDIVQGGMVKKIEVFFQNSLSFSSAAKSSPVLINSVASFFSREDIKNLFDPHKMTIRAELENGTVNIPATHLKTTGTEGIVSVTGGILHIENANGSIDSSKVVKGRLDVNLLHHDNDFNGEFEITADLAHLNEVLQKILARTPVSRELALLRDINGKTVGTLKLERKNHKKPSISVNTQNISLNTRYPGLPGNLTITGGKFSYNDDMISVANLKGRVGQSVFSDLSASLTLDREHILNIKSGTSVMVLEQILPWLGSFNGISASSILQDIVQSKGNIYLVETAFKGKIMETASWNYLVKGSCDKITIRKQYGKDEISDIKAEFLLTPSLTRISLGNALIRNTEFISLLLRDLIINDNNDELKKIAGLDFRNIAVLNDIRTPFSISDAEFQQKSGKDNITGMITDISGRVVFDDGLELYLTTGKERYLKRGNEASENNYAKTGFLKTDDVKTGSKSKDNDESRYKIQVKVYDRGVESVMILYDSKQQPSFQFAGVLDTANIAALLNPVSETYNSLISLTGRKEFSIESDQAGYYKIKTKELDLDFIIEQQKMVSRHTGILPSIFALAESALKSKAPIRTPSSQPTESSLTPIATTTTTTTSSPIFITFDCDRFTHKKMTIAPFSAHIALNGKNKDINIKKMKICNINALTRIRIKDNLVEISLVLDDKNKNIEPVISCLYHGERLMKGDFSLKGTLYAHGELGTQKKRTDKTDIATGPDPDYINLDSLKKSLAGQIEVTSNGGRIFRLTLLSRILSVINIAKFMEGKFPDIEQNGFAFKSISILADVENGRIILKQAVIHGLDMTLVFIGWIDIFTRKIDLTCLVAPFKTADSIIEKIPVINTMMSGRLISVPVKATGTLSNPDVTVLHPSEVAKSILHTMQDILTTPFKLIDLIE